MQSNAVDNKAKVQEGFAGIPAVSVSLPTPVSRAIQRFQEGQKSGSLTLHFKEGRIMEVVETIPTRM